MNDNCKKVSELLTAQTMEFALDEMAAKIAKMHPSADNMIVLGMASRGIPLAKKLTERLTQKFGKPIEMGSLDATYYRAAALSIFSFKIFVATLIAFLSKSVGDMVLIIRGLKIFKQEHLLKWCIPVEFIHAPFTVLAVLFGLFGRFKWK